MTMQNQQYPYLFHVRSHDKPDPNDPNKMIPGTSGLETAYGANEQEAQNALFSRIGQDYDVRSEGIDPLFTYRQSISNNYNAQNPYFTNSGAGQGLVNTGFTPMYANQPNPYMQNMGMQNSWLQNFAPTQTTRRTEPQNPWTAALSQQDAPQMPQAPAYDPRLMGGPTAPLPSQAGTFENPYAVTPMQPIPYEPGVSRGGGGGYYVPGSVPMGGFGMNFPGQDFFAPAYTQDVRAVEKAGRTVDELSAEEIDQTRKLKEQIEQNLGLRKGFKLRPETAEPSALESAWMSMGAGGIGGGGGSFAQLEMIKDRERNNALLSAGVTPGQFNSDDPAVLQQVINTLQESGIFIEGPFAEPAPMFGEDPYERRERELDMQARTFELTESQRRQAEEAEVAEETVDEEQDEFIQRAITPSMFSDALNAVREAQAGNNNARLPEEIVEEGFRNPEGISGQLVADFARALGRTTPYGIAEQQREDILEETTSITIPQQDIQRHLDVAGMNNRSQDYRTAVGFASEQMQAQSQERMTNASIRSSEMIAQASNMSNEYIAELQSNTTLDVARMNNMTQEQVALISSRSAAEVAEITGMSQRDVANIKGQWEDRIANATNLSRETIQRLQNDSAKEVASISASSASNVATINTMASIAIAEASNSTQEEVARLQTQATTTVAENNNTTEVEIAELIYSTKAYELREAEFKEQEEFMKIQQEYAKELAALGAAEGIQTSEEAILKANLDASEELQEAQIEYEKGKYEYENEARIEAEKLLAEERKDIRDEQKEAAELLRDQQLEDAETLRDQQLEDIEDEYERSDKLLEDQQQREDDLREAEQEYQETLTKAEQDYQDEVREDIQEFQTQEREGQAETAEELERLRVLGGYANPQEWQQAQIEISRGGLTAEENESLQALLARGGLTAEQRLAEISSETRSAEMNSLLALLSNPQALGAFVTILTGEIPFDAVPTMGQLTEMTPSRIEYLQGALSALGIDPQTFIRMAQDVTPQAFQESGPFGQLSAMIA